jgi:methylated-DNA-[protein]-cysteine S-methyltransferase
VTLGDRPQVRSRSTISLLTDEVWSAGLGTVVLAAHDGRLCAVEYADGHERMTRLLARRYASFQLVPMADPFGFSGAIRAYLAGDLTAIDDLRVDAGGTAFQRAVWAALRRVPAGRTITYGELARTIGHPSAVRAAGAANGRNPVSIVVPCHRVVGRRGSLVGYAGGLSRKRWLLAHEGARVEDLVSDAVTWRHTSGGVPSTLIRPND